MNYYNAFIERYNFLESYYECMSVLNAIHLYFPNNGIIMKAITDLPEELVRAKVKGDIDITIRHNENTIYNKDPRAKYTPYRVLYTVTLHQALYDEVDGVISSTNSKPKLVGLNMVVSKERILFEIETTKKGE